MSAVAAPTRKSWLPRSMASRLYLIILAGLLLAQGLSVALQSYERYESTMLVMLNTTEHEVGTFVAILDRLPAQERPDWIALLQRDSRHFVLGPGQPGLPLTSVRSRNVVDLIAREVGPDYRVHGDVIAADPSRYQVHFTLHDGSPITLEITPYLQPVASWLFVVLALQLLLLLVCAWLAV